MNGTGVGVTDRENNAKPYTCMNASEHAQLQQLKEICRKLTFRLETAKSFLTAAQVKAYEKQVGILPNTELLPAEEVAKNQLDMFKR